MTRRWIGFLLVLLCLLGMGVPVMAAEPPAIAAETAVVMDPASGYVVYQKNMHQKMYPASMTKVMTALLVLELGDLNDVVTISAKAVGSIDPLESTNVALEEGEQVSVKTLLYSILLPSANDGAYALAEYIGSTELQFVDLMNERAAQLGAMNTHFANASGLHDEQHYTTAYDMALIVREAMKNPTFAEIVSSSVFVFPATNKRQETTYANTNHLVSRFMNTAYQYEKAIGVKTGFTDQAKHTLSAAAKSGNHTLISVVGGCPIVEDRVTSFDNTKDLFEYAFANFESHTFVTANQMIAEYDIPNAKGDSHLLLLSPVSQEAYLPKDWDASSFRYDIQFQRPLKAPIKKGEVVGTATAYYEDQPIATIELQADRDVKRSILKSIGLSIRGFFDRFKIIKYTFLTLLLLFVLLLLFRTYNLRKRRSRKRRVYRYRRRFR